MVININTEIPKSNIKFITIQNKSVIVHVCFVLFIVCLYIFVCECLLQNNNHKTKHKNNTNCRSALEPGASGLPYYCASICVCSCCNWRASSVDSKKKKKTKDATGGSGYPPYPLEEMRIDWYHTDFTKGGLCCTNCGWQVTNSGFLMGRDGLWLFSDMSPGKLYRTRCGVASHDFKLPYKDFFSFILWFGRPKPITGLSGCWTPD